MHNSLKLTCLLAGLMLATSVSAQSASAKSQNTQPRPTQNTAPKTTQNTATQANTRNPGIQGAKTRVENITNYGAVKSSNTYTVNKSTDQARIIKEQNAVEKQHQKEVAKKYSATGKPVPSPVTSK